VIRNPNSIFAKFAIYGNSPYASINIRAILASNYGGPWLTVPELLFEKKQLIPTLQQLLISYLKPIA